MIVSKEALLKAGLREGEVEIPGVGSVRVRGVSRAEYMKIKDMEGIEADAFTIAVAMIEPELTYDEAKDWVHNTTFLEAGLVIGKIVQLSGLALGADKETWKELESDPDSEFRDGPSEGSGNDGGSTPSGDV